MAIEIERKYLGINDFGWLKSRLLEIGATSNKIHFEQNIVFDNKDRSLFNEGKLLRLRMQIWKDHSCNLLTLKLPAQKNNSVKIREEREIFIDNGDVIKNIFLGLGYEICASYEKFREHWIHEKFSLDMDILPFMKCIEIEADHDNIDYAENILGLTKCHKSIRTYHDLHKEWCIQNNLTEQLSFNFSDLDRDKLMNKLL